MNIAPFHVGQRVVAVDALPGSWFKNGREYTISDCEYKMSGNPIANGRWFWYVGTTCRPGPYYRPSIFAPIMENFQPVELEKVLEEETKLISSN